ncbi:stress responsive a b barrel domain-containing protein [Pyronema omphalodes]|nr:stress responsive a b barrel domain-containing protein [Pyronema omphalodes]
MTITHIVLVKLPQATAEDFKTLSDGFNSLATGCKKPDGSTYILSVKGGLENSPEAALLNKGFTHGWVVEFASKEDRDYYILEDPVHAAYATELVKAAGSVDNVLVFDFTPGQ